MTNLDEFEKNAEEIYNQINVISSSCKSSNKRIIKQELVNLQGLVRKTYLTIDKILNTMSNLNRYTLLMLGQSLEDVIKKLETSVCVPEFCANEEIYEDCGKLTDSLKNQLEEIKFCHVLSGNPTGKFSKTEPQYNKQPIKRYAPYRSAAPTAENISSYKSKKQQSAAPKCRMRSVKKAYTSASEIPQLPKEFKESSIKSIGKFHVVSYNSTEPTTGRKHKRNIIQKKSVNKRKRQRSIRGKKNKNKNKQKKSRKKINLF